MSSDYQYIYDTVLLEQIKYVKNLSVDQKKFLEEYTTDSFDTFNHRLRTGVSLTIMEEKMLNVLRDCYKKVPLLKQSITVYRGTKTDISNQSEKSYISTSLNYELARNRFAGKNCCVLQITVHPKSRVLPLVEVSANPDEEEILLDKDGVLIYRGSQIRDDIKVYIADYYDQKPTVNVEKPVETKSNDEEIINRLVDFFKDEEDIEPDDLDFEIDNQYKTFEKTRQSVPDNILRKVKERLKLY